eukprot:TRINITY_DN5526_c0_g1_i3.p1 TRINITY_DN5526_c0_g1~~TRINITY_DN5526_c0_g1_i3.p1  ORF type:complete len:227 (+),score=0.18 TRINITY_DN5526_c0_g1_i3:110-790(+)
MALQSTPALNHLAIFLERTDTTFLGVQKFLLFLPSLSNLREFGISLSRLTDDEGVRICEALTNLTSLSFLQLFFSFCREFSMGVTHSISRMLSSLTSLLHLELIIWSCTLTDDGLIAIADTLSQLSSLTLVNLSLGYTGVSDLGVSKIIEALQKLAHLTEFRLNLYHCHCVTDVFANRIADLLRRCISIVKVMLVLSISQITKAGEKEICKVASERKFDSFELVDW